MHELEPLQSHVSHMACSAAWRSLAALVSGLFHCPQWSYKHGHPSQASLSAPCCQMEEVSFWRSKANPCPPCCSVLLCSSTFPGWVRDPSHWPSRHPLYPHGHTRHAPNPSFFSLHRRAPWEQCTHTDHRSSPRDSAGGQLASIPTPQRHSSHQGHLHL